MGLYRCVCYSEDALQPGSKPVLADSDAQAHKVARKMLHDDPDLDRVEVWSGSDLVFRLNRRQVQLEIAARGSDR